MAASDISICNLGLAEVHQKPISSFTEDNERAINCSLIYVPSRDETLEDHPWNFAIRKAEIARLEEAPLFEWNFKYPLPQKPPVIRVLQLVDKVLDFEIIGQILETDETSPIKIKYIGKIENAATFSATFITTLALLLASKLALILNQNEKLSKTLFDKYLLRVGKSRHNSSLEGKKPKFIDQTLINARRH